MLSLSGEFYAEHIAVTKQFLESNWKIYAFFLAVKVTLAKAKMNNVRLKKETSKFTLMVIELPCQDFKSEPKLSEERETVEQGYTAVGQDNY